MSKVRPFYPTSVVLRERFREYVADRWRQWQEHWLVETVASEWQMQDASRIEQPAVQWRQFGIGKFEMYLSVTSRSRETLLQAMFGASEESADDGEWSHPILRSVWEQAVRDLAMRMLGGSAEAIQQSSKSPPPEAWLRSSGFVLGTLGTEQCTMQCLFSPALMLRQLGSERDESQRPPLIHRESLLGNETTKLHVILSDIELSLAELDQLRVGDIIRSDTLLEQGLELRTQEQRTIARCQLGRSDENIAVKIG